jgi:ATP-binding cassette subfamily B protein
MTALPRVLRALLVLALRVDRRRLLVAAALMAVGYLATPGIALALRGLVNAALERRVTFAVGLALAIAALLVFELMMNHFAHLYYFEVGERCEVALNDELIEAVNGPPGVEHLGGVEFADGIALVREELARTRDALESALQFLGLVLQVVVTTAIVGLLDPWLILLPVAALPPVLVGRRAQAVVERAREAVADRTRLNLHLLAVATTGASVKEVRLFQAEADLMRRQAEGWSATTGVLQRAHLRAALLRACGQAVFAMAYAAAILLVARQAVTGRASVGDVILVITLAVQVSVQVSSALGTMARLQAADATLQRLATLRRLGARAGTGAAGIAPAPVRLDQGIRLEGVAYAYPGGHESVLRDLDITLPAGATVAIVGENGAGKSTLVRLLCGLSTPTRGRITVDGADLRDISPADWRGRVAVLPQDFARFELRLRDNVGAGDVARLDDDEALAVALARAGAARIAAAVPGGLDGLLGRGYGDGVELSGGEWQSLGLARASMRRAPLLLALDEPAASLDAMAEHAIFERYRVSRDVERRRSGAITVLVSHRFSTVRMADLIVVLAGGTVREAGRHAELMARGGLYAELFMLQSRAYR